MTPAWHAINGKAFEYACIAGLERVITAKSKDLKCNVIKDGPYDTALQCFNKLSSEHKSKLSNVGIVLGENLIKMEPRLVYAVAQFNSNIDLSIQPDQRGQRGDVRDILVVRIKSSNDTSWEIGISCKHNHRAVKHPRVSPHIDIGTEWLKAESDEIYWSEINKVFDKVSAYQAQGLKRWAEIPDKDINIYRPAMEAIRGFLYRIYQEKGFTICRNLLHYLIGRNDFYKAIITLDKGILDLQAYNFNRTLNKPAGGNRPTQRIETVKLPATLHSIDFKSESNSTINIVLNEGWQISMRVHSATTNIEKSLKLDVQLVGVPQNLFRQNLTL
ncbi:HaeIII family restriction endonuclease [bacterium]|nr:HaeIII family restriction endonuclease [bacterium]